MHEGETAPSASVVWGVRGAYVLVIAIATLSSMELDLDLSAIGSRVGRMIDPTLSVLDFVDAVRNLALFAGWGAVWVITARSSRLGRLVVSATVSGAAISLGVECLQLLSAVRRSSIVDVLTNTSGAFGGAVGLIAVIAIATALKGRKSYVGLPALIIAVAYGSAVAIEAIIPLTRAVPLDQVSGGAIPRFRAAWEMVRFGPAGEIPVSDLWLFAPLGLVGVVALVEMGFPRARAGMLVTAVGALAGLCAEIVRGALALPIELGIAVFHALALGLGAWIAVRGIPRFSRSYRGADGAALVVLCYVILLACWAWRPYYPETDLGVIASQFSLSRLVPLGAHSWRVDLFSVADIGKPFALYFSLGAMLSVWPVRLAGAWSRYWPGLYASVVLEVGQVFVATRFVDGTDVVLQGAGVVIGWAALRRAGFRPYGELVRRGAA